MNFSPSLLAPFHAVYRQVLTIRMSVPVKLLKEIFHCLFLMLRVIVLDPLVLVGRVATALIGG